MATWSPATASCDFPEATAEMMAPAAGNAGVRSFVGRGGGRGGGGASFRGRRAGSRARAVSEMSEAGGDEDRSWRREDSGAPGEHRASDVGAATGGAGVGRGRGRSKKEDVVWVQCDNCLRWRKLALGMLFEHLPDKW